MMSTRNEIRKSLRTKRQGLSQVEQKEFSDDLLIQLSARRDVLAAKNIALYLANDSELDAMPFIKWCWQNNKKIYLPVIHPFSHGQLLFLHYDENSAMKKNNYGILEPKLDVRLIKTISEIDIIFTPLVAFDRLGNRLGMGGGFYDRTLSSWYQQYRYQNQELDVTSSKLTKPYPIGLAHDIQLIDAIPTQLWDIPLPEIITPTKQYKFNIHK
ncbi:5-formyltetrahydrofolate cyclo-ligase [Colwellia sp. MB02u-6]|uniref:5-formyltetrahydrofolate cyclo-ligase n=1 Tax=Colwellia sp. MB02u-6 TaxID=2759824 RepID=UPI0021753734|nr:5-formyltetrahydrofolate cyclo-ligase [Colwellia sp. MB02u-6]